MKKILSIAMLIALCAGGSAFAQQTRRVSEVHYTSTHIERIFMHRLGFIVTYRTGLHQMASVFIPGYWFTDPGGRGEIVHITGSEWPSMVVFTRNGEFSHVRLRLRRHRGHQTWGVVPLTVSIDEFFQGIQEIRLEQ